MMKWKIWCWTNVKAIKKTRARVEALYVFVSQCSERRVHSPLSCISRHVMLDFLQHSGHPQAHVGLTPTPAPALATVVTSATTS